MATRGEPLAVDIRGLKGRIGEAFVEAILRRANYFVARVGRETHVPRVMKAGPDAYMPDFLAWREEHVASARGDKPLFSVLAVEVKYRADPEEFSPRRAAKLLADAHEHWPNFCIILVTDHPEDNRSCFQVLRHGPASLPESVDLADAGLDVFASTVAVFSMLLREVFRALSEASVGDDLRSLL